ncbi:hypothetical protein CLAFUW4_07002 [Fulvia fulva]|uniref:Uncharacterized protein n=1 Tax=Passalora fulva TaxID=5499 RepID=A0A9Q8UQW4_PASFU|nr:uncharacterized protein CLAFUR5_07138 [Fulvia fulva]KAK4622340.1 hypothetical protein CLAFUR4_07011 [Fulvia fulva]KAK4622614.1 hypothetical protein CLAFUR0_07009 [Fulvia fulva]UJO19091.1 hypothetical protein CLAFUR5_07138 [Fulvia fulva]WPV16230.1 hypothetical protein CLAFUW4_07002 [Fulvia fulva]WPV30745.1 hypothetical protein CLAFUW7_07002 [Fulvia fulva]
MAPRKKAKRRDVNTEPKPTQAQRNRMKITKRHKKNVKRQGQHSKTYRKLQDLLSLAIPLGCNSKSNSKWAVSKIFAVDDLLECYAQLKMLLKLAEGTKLSFHEICLLCLAELGLRDFSLDELDADRALELVRDETLSQSLPEYKNLFKNVVKNAALKKKKEANPDMADAIDDFIKNELEYEDMEPDNEFDFERARHGIRHHLNHAHREEDKFPAFTDSEQRKLHEDLLVHHLNNAMYYETQLASHNRPYLLTQAWLSRIGPDGIRCAERWRALLGSRNDHVAPCMEGVEYDGATDYESEGEQVQQSTHTGYSTTTLQGEDTDTGATSERTQNTGGATATGASTGRIFSSTSTMPPPQPNGNRRVIAATGAKKGRTAADGTSSSPPPFTFPAKPTASADASATSESERRSQSARGLWHRATAKRYFEASVTALESYRCYKGQ